MGLTQITTGGVDDNINIDSDTLKVDGTNNRVGIGTSSPTTSLHIQGANTTGKGQLIVSSASAGQEARMTFIDGSDDIAEISTDGDNLYFYNERSSGAFQFYTGGSERARIDSSGRLLVGTTGSDQDALLTVARTGDGGSSPSTISSATVATFRATGGLSHEAHVSILGGSTGASQLNLGDRDDEDVASIRYDHNNNFMQFNASATERMRIDSSGNFLIGTSTPGAGGAGKLTLAASGDSGVTIRSGTTSNGAVYFADGTSGSDRYRGYIEYNHNVNYLRFGTDDTERIRIDNTGNVGLGEPSPDTRLHVKESTTGATGIFIQNSNGATNSSADLFFGNWNGSSTTTPQARIQAINTNVNTASTDLAFWTYSGSSTIERMRIDSDGVVKINQSGTENKFRIQNTTSGESSMLIQNSSTGYSPGNGLYLGIGSNESSYLWNYHNEPMIFGTNNVERARFDTSGRFLLAVTSASSHIHNNISRLFGNLHLGANMTLGKSGGDYDGIGYNVGWQSSNGSYKYVVSDTSAFIKFGGGSGRIETFTASAGTAGNSISFTTGPYVASGGTSWTSGSDERLKTNLAPIENGLEKVGTLRAVTGRFLTDEESTSRSFLIAQDVQTVLPEAVDTSDSERLGLDYSAMIPLLVAALKEAKDKIETLETKVAALEAA